MDTRKINRYLESMISPFREFLLIVAQLYPKRNEKRGDEFLIFGKLRRKTSLDEQNFSG